MMNEKFVEGIADLAERARTPGLMEINGISYTDKKVFVAKAPDPVASTLEISTLTGLVDYLKANKDNLKLKEVAIHIQDYDCVRVLSRLTEYFQERSCYVEATAKNLLGQFLSKPYHDCEAFVIWLQSVFLSNEDRERVLSVVGNVKDESVRMLDDNGTTQTVTARAGIVKVSDVRIPNPVKLKPYRTFVEIDQPESEFILRLKSGGEGGMPSCALFEADGGRWKLTAIQRIRDFLTEELKDTEVSIIA